MAELNGHVYAVGGYDGSVTLSSGEKYDPRLNEWKPIAPMAKDRACFGLVSLGDCLYAIGGDGKKCGEKYDPSEDRWSPIPEMDVGKCNLAAATLGGRLFVIGESVTDEEISAELFDPVVNRWEIATPPPINAKFAALAWFLGFAS